MAGILNKINPDGIDFQHGTMKNEHRANRANSTHRNRYPSKQKSPPFAEKAPGPWLARCVRPVQELTGLAPVRYERA